MVPKIDTTTSTCQLIFATVCFWPVVGAYYGLKYTFKAAEATVSTGLDVYTRVRVKTRRLRKSKPLATTSAEKAPASPIKRTGTSFLHLPPELRLHIYALAFGNPAIAQVQTRSAFWGPRPETWGPAQGIRDDGDPPSATLRCTVALGGSGLKQQVGIPHHGCVHYGALSQMLCGDQHHFRPGWVRPDLMVFHADLMRACRVVYDEVLDVLYARNTISLFGADIARYFCHNASPEGLKRVRCVHVAHVLPSDGWDRAAQRKNVEDAMRGLREALPGLRQLDVEVVLTWGQPKNPVRLWEWLRDDVLAQFRGLDRFVLKLSVYRPFTPVRYAGYEGWLPEYEPLSSWDDGEYQALKERVLLLDETASS
ncbi:hypothetical protein F4781DRAFT_410383 [Annulohypoxylon bovei var. microspora]|nr:hypothetical protein F4781DRAFT_410383 [Annulohypoxylon bovei var. microspora]